MFHAGEMISNQDPTSLTIDALVVLSRISVFGSNTSETEVDGKAFMRLCGNTSQVWTRRNFCLFSADASGALIEDCCLSVKLGYASDKLVSIACSFITWVSKVLVPEQLLCATADSIDWYCFVH